MDRPLTLPEVADILSISLEALTDMIENPDGVGDGLRIIEFKAGGRTERRVTRNDLLLWLVAHRSRFPNNWWTIEEQVRSTGLKVVK